jgi:hypothetical protein
METPMRIPTMMSLAAGALAVALLLPAPRAEAMTLPLPSGIAEAAQDLDAVDQVRTVCRRYWNGYRWRTRCYWVPDRRPYRRYRHRYYRRW